MPENKAHELLRKHNLSVDDVKDRRTTLHHLRNIVHAEQLPFDVFKALVKMRR
jgi:hypoxanthine phosphoribosyltransferase